MRARYACRLVPLTIVAGAVRIELTTSELETDVIPFHQTPKRLRDQSRAKVDSGDAGNHCLLIELTARHDTGAPMP